MSIQPPKERDTLVTLGTEQEDKQRQRMLLLFLFLLLLLVCVGVLFFRYLRQPAPLPDLLPLPVNANYSPHYLFSIYGVDKPVGIALSPEDDQIYVAEVGGNRMVKMFDRDGDLLGSFVPPRTRSGERSPVYLATDSAGYVFVTDRLQHAVFVYDREGTYLDTMLGPELTLSEYVSEYVDDPQTGFTFAYNVFESGVYYQKTGEAEQILPAPESAGWSPLGVRVDRTGRLLLTDVAQDHHAVRAISISVADSVHNHIDLPDSEAETSVVVSTTRSNRDTDASINSQVSPMADVDQYESELICLPGCVFSVPEVETTVVVEFGTSGQGDGQLLFPNSAVADSQDRIYVTDSNNGRISVWQASIGGQSYSFVDHFGQGAGEDALNLPRGAAIDARDRLYVVDTVGQDVHVYDVSGAEPIFLFAFGDWGLDDGQFDYPNDIALDATGRLYVTDRENNRILVWSY